MRLRSLSIPLHRKRKPAVTASMNLPVPTVYFEIDDAKNIKEILPMVAFMDKDLEKWCEEYEASRKNHELHFEISIAWDDDDEFEHEGYYHSVDDAIEALLKYKK